MHSAIIENSEKKRGRRTYLKSVYSMLLQVGVLPKIPDKEVPQPEPEPTHLTLVANIPEKAKRRTTMKVVKIFKEHELPIDLLDPELHKKFEKITGETKKTPGTEEWYLILFKKLLTRCVTQTGRLLLPRNAKRSTDSIMKRAQRVLVETNVIRQADHVKKAKKKRQKNNRHKDYFSKLLVQKLSEKLNI